MWKLCAPERVAHTHTRQHEQVPLESANAGPRLHSTHGSTMVAPATWSAPATDHALIKHSKAYARGHTRVRYGARPASTHQRVQLQGVGVRWLRPDLRVPNDDDIAAFVLRRVEAAELEARVRQRAQVAALRPAGWCRRPLPLAPAPRAVRPQPRLRHAGGAQPVAHIGVQLAIGGPRVREVLRERAGAEGFTAAVAAAGVTALATDLDCVCR
jgi:hypothetical protein